ncbi:MAG: D-glucuronyl C5-epimerase family protein [Actinomycetes bacterium]
MRRTPFLCVASALVTLALCGAASANASTILVLDQSGHLSRESNPLIPAAEISDLSAGLGRSLTASAARSLPAQTASSRNLEAAIGRVAGEGAISAVTHADYASAIASARRTAGHLRGQRRNELRAVIANFDRMARAGLATSSRLAPMIETLRRNTQWWTKGSLLSYGQRVGFKGSQLVWQSYPGQGLQIQWLGTFGYMNALVTAQSKSAELHTLAGEVSRLAVKRAGGLAWEYLFQFGGGRPPWVSGLAQGTGVQALASTSQRFKQPELLKTAESAMGIFRTGPPSGVRLNLAHGSYYLAYSYAPGQRIYNAFYQSLNGLHDLAQISGNKSIRQLWLRGQTEGRYELPFSDTGSWSYYEPGSYSPLNYHRVLRDFIRGMCDRMTADREREAAALRLKQGPDAVLGNFTDWPNPGPYCVMAQRFTKYLYAQLGLTMPAPSSR